MYSDHYILHLLLHRMGATSEAAQLLRVTVKPRIQKDKWSLYWKVCCWTLRCTFSHCQSILKDGPRRQRLAIQGDHAELLSKGKLLGCHLWASRESPWKKKPPGALLREQGAWALGPSTHIL